MFDQIVSEVAGVVGCVTELERDGLPAVIAELGRMRAMLDALEAMSLDVFAGSLAWADEGAASPLAWVKSNVGVRAGTAKRMLRVGELARCHPEVAGSLGTGRITLDHAVLLAAVDIPATAEQFAHDVGLLVGWAEELPADDFATVCRQWLALADEEGAERKSRRRFERRRLHLSQMLDGNWKLDAVLDAGEGAALHEAISRQVHDRYRADDAAKQTDPTLVFDTTPAQARADALGEVVRRGVAASAGAPRPSVSLIIDERALDEGGDAVTHGGAFLPGPTVQRFLCDCDVHSVVVNSLGLPVNLGRTARLVNAAQRRAIIARDRHCVFPGCDRPPAACQVHHVEWWEHGGATDIGNNVLLCSHHHHLVHEGGWQLTVERESWTIMVARPDGRSLGPPRRHRRRDRHRTPEFLIDRSTRHDMACVRERVRGLVRSRAR